MFRRDRCACVCVCERERETQLLSQGEQTLQRINAQAQVMFRRDRCVSGL
jgi:hypothetical protein